MTFLITLNNIICSIILSTQPEIDNRFSLTEAKMKILHIKR